MRKRGVRRLSESGFTLIELTVAMTVFLVVLLVSFSLLFTLRSFAQREQNVADARQSARRAMDYITYYARGAGDLNLGNTTFPSPNALVMWVQTKTGGTNVKTSANNYGLDAANDTAGGADAGTDVLTLAYPRNTRLVPINNGDVHTTGNLTLDYRDGCDGTANANVNNLAAFNNLLGVTATNLTPLTLVIANNGNWTYYKTVSGGASVCNCGAATNPYPTAQVITMTNTAGTNDYLRPPFVAADVVVAGTVPPRLAVGVQLISFRVLTDAAGGHHLQQKDGLFDPGGKLGAADNPGTAFTSLMENVEDFQVAYVYDDGSIWNNGTNEFAAGTSYIPPQVTIGQTASDIGHVVALRLSIVARASVPFSVMELHNDMYWLPTVEDHVQPAHPQPAPPATDPNRYRYYRYTMTATIMMRGRMLGG